MAICGYCREGWIPRSHHFPKYRLRLFVPPLHLAKNAPRRVSTGGCRRDASPFQTASLADAMHGRRWQIFGNMKGAQPFGSIQRLVPGSVHFDCIAAIPMQAFPISVSVQTDKFRGCAQRTRVVTGGRIWAAAGFCRWHQFQGRCRIWPVASGSAPMQDSAAGTRKAEWFDDVSRSSVHDTFPDPEGDAPHADTNEVS